MRMPPTMKTGCGRRRSPWWRFHPAIAGSGRGVGFAAVGSDVAVAAAVELFGSSSWAMGTGTRPTDGVTGGRASGGRSD